MLREPPGKLAKKEKGLPKLTPSCGAVQTVEIIDFLSCRFSRKSFPLQDLKRIHYERHQERTEDSQDAQAFRRR